MTFRDDRNNTSGRAVGMAAGLTMAVGGAVTALMLTAGPSIADAWNGADNPADVEVIPATPSVYVVDGDGNLVAADGSNPAMAQSSRQSDESTGQYGDHEEEDYDEEGYEHGDHDEYEDDYEDHDEYEDDDYEDHDD